MNDGENVWKCICGHKWRQATHPEECPRCKERYSIGPAVPAYRLQGEECILYDGRTPWQEAANSYLWNHARSSFVDRQPGYMPY